MTHWLIIEPDTESRAEIVNGLKARGHRTTTIVDPYGLAAALVIHRPNAVLIAFAETDSQTIISICEGLRSWSVLPLFIVSDCDNEWIKVQLLDAGADDYILKPVGIDELMARLRTIERRQMAQVPITNPVITVGNLSIDVEARTVRLAGELLRLTRKEFELLRVLAVAQGKLVSYEKLLTAVWGENRTTNERASLRTLIKQLRRKMRNEHSAPDYLLTEPGVGYRLMTDATKIPALAE